MFVHSASSASSQIPTNLESYSAQYLEALVARLSLIHRLAVSSGAFCREGPDDEIEASQIYRRHLVGLITGHRLEAAMINQATACHIVLQQR